MRMHMKSLGQKALILILVSLFAIIGFLFFWVWSLQQSTLAYMNAASNAFATMNERGFLDISEKAWSDDCSHVNISLHYQISRESEDYGSPNIWLIYVNGTLLDSTSWSVTDLYPTYTNYFAETYINGWHFDVMLRYEFQTDAEYIVTIVTTLGHENLLRAASGLIKPP